MKIHAEPPRRKEDENGEEVLDGEEGGGGEVFGKLLVQVDELAAEDIVRGWLGGGMGGLGR